MRSFSVALKSGVDARKLTPEALLGLWICSQVFGQHGIPFVVTSISDGKHGERSLHYVGNAFDVRLASRYTQSASSDEELLGDMRLALGGENTSNARGQYDVILEGDHFHVEFDPL